ncbi:MAG: hypothetical protein QNJ98_08580 [Planctomycetota bacterium]|nr:hypothetical protein [Planctomycetota bacterium]
MRTVADTTPGFRPLLWMLLLCLAVTGGCGVDSGDPVPNWQVTGIGPAGGSIAAGDVFLTVAPGALLTDIPVSIIPQLDPFIIQPGPNDLCTYSYLGPLWCCGPVGQDLQAASAIRVYYDETLIPAGFTETDLVLLEWNDTLGVLEPNLGATQNTTENYFENTGYMQLGHVAIGIRDCSQATGQIVAAGNANVVAAPSDGVYVTTVDGSVAEFVTGVLPDTFVPSPDGTSILFQLTDPQTEGTLLETAPTTGGATTPVAGMNDSVVGGDPRFGWLLQPPTDRVWFNQFRPTQSMTLELPALVNPNVDQTVLVRRNADASDPITGIHGVDTATAFIRDIRQSPTGEHFLLVLGTFQTQGLGEIIEVIETATGTVVSSGLIPPSGGQHSPRFTPDGTGVYLVDNFQTNVVRYDLDGTNEQTIFSFGPGEVISQIQDAVMAPDGQTLGVIIRGISTDVLYNVTADTQMLGIVNETFDLGTTATYDEVIFHPSQNVLYLDPGRTGVRAFTMDAAAAVGSRIVDHGTLPAQTMSLMDIELSTGNLLHLTLQQAVVNVGDSTRDVAATASTQGPGICVTDPIGGNLEVGPGIGIDIYAARWLATFRTTPGMFTDLVR